jgi:hypothetical protein
VISLLIKLISVQTQQAKEINNDQSKKPTKIKQINTQIAIKPNLQVVFDNYDKHDPKTIALLKFLVFAVLNNIILLNIIKDQTTILDDIDLSDLQQYISCIQELTDALVEKLQYTPNYKLDDKALEDKLFSTFLHLLLINTKYDIHEEFNLNHKNFDQNQIIKKFIDLTGAQLDFSKELDKICKPYDNNVIDIQYTSNVQHNDYFALLSDDSDLKISPNPGYHTQNFMIIIYIDILSKRNINNASYNTMIIDFWIAVLRYFKYGILPKTYIADLFLKQINPPFNDEKTYVKEIVLAIFNQIKEEAIEFVLPFILKKFLYLKMHHAALIFNKKILNRYSENGVKYYKILEQTNQDFDKFFNNTTEKPFVLLQNFLLTKYKDVIIQTFSEDILKILDAFFYFFYDKQKLIVPFPQMFYNILVKSVFYRTHHSHENEMFFSIISILELLKGLEILHYTYINSVEITDQVLYDLIAYARGKNNECPKIIAPFMYLRTIFQELYPKIDVIYDNNHSSTKHVLIDYLKLHNKIPKSIDSNYVNTNDLINIKTSDKTQAFAVQLLKILLIVDDDLFDHRDTKKLVVKDEQNSKKDE